MTMPTGSQENDLIDDEMDELIRDIKQAIRNLMMKEMDENE